MDPTSAIGSPNIGQQIDSLVQQFTDSETTKLIDPLKTKQKRYQNLSDGYDKLTTKLTALKSSLYDLKQTGTDSIFASKTTSSSNSDFVDATATSTASASGYDIRVDQLAKSDVAISPDMTSSALNATATAGTHDFVIASGDGKGGQFTSNVSVTFATGETNQTAMEKVRDAIIQNRAVVTSAIKTASNSYTGGASTFTIDLNGTKTDISVVGGSTYSALMDEITNAIGQSIPGITAAKVLDQPSVGDAQLTLTVTDPSNYISITAKSGFDVVTDLGIGATNLKSAAGIVTASVFSPTSTTSQLSLTATKTGLDYRIEDISDSGTSTALAAVGLNLGAARPVFDQTTNPDTAGFIYADTTTANNQLNSKFTFNGLSIQRNSNSIDDLATGVTFQLKSVMQPTDNSANIVISNDVKTVEDKLKNFISKFNDVYTNIKNNSISGEYERGIFVGDSNASTLLSLLTSVSYSKIQGISTGNLSYLSQIGITFDPMNGLSIGDESKLQQKIKDSADQVAEIFNSANGIATTLYSDTSNYLGAGGSLSLSKSNLGDNIKSIRDRIAFTTSRIDKNAEALRQQYVNLQIELSILTNTQRFFSIGGSNGSFFG